MSGLTLFIDILSMWILDYNNVISNRLKRLSEVGPSAHSCRLEVQLH